ncbi:MAG TPA: 4-hydroxy-3-methylbut-2-enyl diphosphate reductase [Gaiella sp.]|nr:4-hydroxy-3-methylbut-2-enyl diphosphate reductase [Gaiella sp.]
MSGSLLVLAPLRLEAAAVNGPDRHVLRVGMGHSRARVAAARALAVDDTGAVAVAGVCAAVSPDLRPGDVVLATELRTEGRTPLPVPGSALLAAALRRRGLGVHAGPVVSVDRILDTSERRSLRPTGALAVDMESAWLADGADGRPLAVLRVVVEDTDHDLLDPRTLTSGVRALAALRRASGALGEWSQAVAPRRILLAGPRSFCAGVERAIEIVQLALEQRGAPVYVRKQIVHNEHVVSDLERRGAIFVEELGEVPPGATVVFSAHGVSPAVKREASERGLDVIDATCPLVSKVHAEARRFAAAGDTVFLVGHRGHEEIEGTSGEAPESIVVVESIDEVDGVAASDPERVSFLTQTTLAVDETNEIVAALRQRYPALRGPRSDDICYATTNRQQAVREIARESDLVLVVGSQTSSNSLRLVEVARREGTPAYLVDDEGDVDVAWLTEAETVGITAGASAPDGLVHRLVDALGALGPVDVEERTTTTESLQFRLPREVAAAGARGERA